jgi:hypothetical protein
MLLKNSRDALSPNAMFIPCSYTRWLSNKTGVLQNMKRNKSTVQIVKVLATTSLCGSDVPDLSPSSGLSESLLEYP